MSHPLMNTLFGEEIWHVVLDRSGHFRSLKMSTSLDKTETVVSGAMSYIAASREADRLNQIAAVQES